jgi:hypothetical protein
MSNNMHPMNPNGWGQGQRVTKQETYHSESYLVVQQALIGAGAMVTLLLAGIAIALIIGQVLVTAAGAAALLKVWLKVAFMPRPQPSYDGEWDRLRWAMIAGITGVLVLWVLLAEPLLIEPLWPSLRFRGGWMYWQGERVMRVALWVRGVMVLLIGGVASFALLLVYRMKTEVLDPNWPPVYMQRNPDLGPWDPVRQNLAPLPHELLQPEVVEVPPEMIRVEHGHQRRWVRDDIPADMELMQRIAHGALFSGVRWSRRELQSRYALSQNKAQAILQSMERAGFLDYPAGRNDPDGGTLTNEGRDFIENLLDV